MKFTAILSTLAAATLVSAGTFHGLPENTEFIPRGYIIEYQEGIRQNVAHMSLKTQQVDYKVRNQYSIFNGAAITVDSEHDGKDLASIPGVKNVWPITVYSIPRTISNTKSPSDPETASLHSMTGVDIAHQKYNLTGKGIKVGVIDSGIDYRHPAFAVDGADAGCFGKNCRVAYGWDFVGDDYGGSNPPKPDADPMDCGGHGTHVAGIIGANAQNIKASPKPPQSFVGVAPEVTFGAYRVFGCGPKTGSDIIMAAMEKAFDDGMDIINMSLGGGSSYKNNPEAVLGDKLVARGMVVAVAAGNDGAQGVWMVSDAGLGDLSSSVASFDNISGRYNSFTYAGTVHPYSPSEAWGKAINLPASATLVPILEKDGSLSDGCDSTRYTGVDVKGKIVLTFGDITRCKSGGRGAIAKTAGAAGILIQTTPFGLASLGGNPEFPMGAIEFKAGQEILVSYKSDPKNTFTWSKAESNFLIEGGGAPSDFSSFGLDGDLRSKPDLAAPGGNILSTYPLAKGGYTVMSGTSMATPYVAGSHALYMQAKNAKPRGDEIRKVFKNTATISKNYGSKTVTSAAKQGGGLINVLNAIETKSSISPDHIDLLDTNHLQRTVDITLLNNGSEAETYTLSHIPADALNSYPTGNSFPLLTPKIEADYASVTFSQTEVQIAAGKSVKITLRFAEPKAGDASHFPIYSGYIIATPASKGSVAVHVPYTGVKGDITKVPIMDIDSGFPSLTAFNAAGNVTTVPKDRKFDMRSRRPVILTRIGSHTPSLEIRVFEAQKQTFVGYLSSVNAGSAIGHSGRNLDVDDHGKKDYTRWIWTGAVRRTANSTRATTLPSGTYQIVVALRKNFSPGVYPGDYEVFDMGTLKF